MSFQFPNESYLIFPEEFESLHLHTSIEVINILALDEAESSMTLQLKFTVDWTDSRLEYINLKTKPEMNVLTPIELDEIWMPTLVFSNTRNKQQAYFRNNSITTIKIKEGKYFILGNCASTYIPL